MKGEADKTRWRISLAAFGLSLATMILAYTGGSILAAWRAGEQRPRLAADSLVKGLRAHHQQTGHFPADFRELEARIWKHKHPPDFGADGCGLGVANYYYLYHRIDAGLCSIWIIPTGPRREEGSSHFLLLAPGNLRRWKGAPLSLDEIKGLPSVPQYREMAVLGLSEQPQIDLAGRKP